MISLIILYILCVLSCDKATDKHPPSIKEIKTNINQKIEKLKQESKQQINVPVLQDKITAARNKINNIDIAINEYGNTLNNVIQNDIAKAVASPRLNSGGLSGIASKALKSAEDMYKMGVDKIKDYNDKTEKAMEKIYREQIKLTTTLSKNYEELLVAILQHPECGVKKFIEEIEKLDNEPAIQKVALKLVGNKEKEGLGLQKMGKIADPIRKAYSKINESINEKPADIIYQDLFYNIDVLNCFSIAYYTIKSKNMEMDWHIRLLKILCRMISSMYKQNLIKSKNTKSDIFKELLILQKYKDILFSLCSNIIEYEKHSEKLLTCIENNKLYDTDIDLHIVRAICMYKIDKKKEAYTIFEKFHKQAAPRWKVIWHIINDQIFNAKDIINTVLKSETDIVPKSETDIYWFHLKMFLKTSSTVSKTTTSQITSSILGIVLKSEILDLHIQYARFMRAKYNKDDRLAIEASENLKEQLEIAESILDEKNLNSTDFIYILKIIEAALFLKDNVKAAKYRELMHKNTKGLSKYSYIQKLLPFQENRKILIETFGQKSDSLVSGILEVS